MKNEQIVCMKTGLILVALIAMIIGLHSSSLRADNPAPEQSLTELPSGMDKSPIAPPRILALTWQEDSAETRTRFWKANGELLTEAEEENLRAEIENTGLHRSTQGQESHPLIIIFDPGNALSERTEGIRTEGSFLSKRIRFGATWSSRKRGRKTPDKMFALSAATLSLDGKTRLDWPDKTNLLLTYPLEDPVLLQTLTEVPREPLKIAEGVTWYIDPQMGFDPRGEKVNGRVVRFPAAVTQSLRAEKLALTRYEVRVYSKESKRPLRNGYTTLKGGGDEPRYLIKVSKRFPSSDEFDRIEIYRQRFARTKINNVQIRSELLPDE